MQIMWSFATQNTNAKREYIQLLSAVSKLSGLFSDGTTPYINYRVVENIFCRSFGAHNLSRSDTAFDAKIGNLGIGLKTFICPKSHKIEKVAEFNALSSHLSTYRGLDLARELSLRRNERIELACNLYDINEAIYHIVARADKKLLLFETDYEPIKIDDVRLIKNNTSSLTFTDGIHEYSFNYSKSTLFRRFNLPIHTHYIPVDILDDPYELLFRLDELQNYTQQKPLIAGQDFVILPLYSTQSKHKEVPLKSGLNQWNAGGRKRDAGEVYIPIPADIHRYCPGFFPPRDTPFTLHTPNQEELSAKVCQENSKALMTNPNKALADWLLRKLFKLQEREILTRERMLLLGFDCVIIYKEDRERYRIDVQPLGKYDDFIEEVALEP